MSISQQIPPSNLSQTAEAAIRQLAKAVGVADSYTDYFDQTQTPKVIWLEKVLATLGFDMTNPELALNTYHDKELQRALPPVIVSPLSKLQEDGLQLSCYWPDNKPFDIKGVEVETENGRLIAFNPKEVTIDCLEDKPLGREDYQEYHLWFPPQCFEHLTQGYHTFKVFIGTEAKHMRLINTPDSCYEPDWLAAGHKIWGPVIQLYALRSEHDWGIGDFGSLKRLTNWMIDHGQVSFVGVNPLHAKSLTTPESASPYMPLTRQFINVLYIDVTAVEGYDEWFGSLAPQDQQNLTTHLDNLRDNAKVDYTSVCDVKLSVLRQLFNGFVQRHIKAETPLAQQFSSYVQSKGERLEQFSTFQALQVKFDGHGWWFWPEEYQSPHNDAVKQFTQTHQDDINYYHFLQWVAETQLDEINPVDNPKLKLGLYPDLAIGCEGAGFESWIYPGLYPRGIAQGLPPGLTTPKGQNWGFAPFSPQKLQEMGYQPFIDVLRANMRNAGALRIDHMFGLQRAFWLPEGAPAEDALYVGHPFEDLMGILALESQRNECVIIGEDLGLPPPGYEEIVAPWKVFSYNMIHYANKQLVAKATASSAYKPESLTVFSNHDKPTLKGMFNGWYPRTIERLGIITAEERDKMIAIRQRTTLESIINQMQLEGYLTRPWTAQHWYDAIVEDIGLGGENVYAEFVWALHAFLAFSSAKLVGVQLEDLLGQDAQVNIPGTADADVENPDVYPKQYPNWRIRLSKPFEALENEALFYEVIGTLSEARGNSLA